MKILSAILVVIALMFLWNSLTCQFCHRPDGIYPEITGEAARASCMDYRPGYVSRSYSWGGWQVRIYVPGYGCIANDPTPVDIGGVRITTWAKGFHREPIVSAVIR